MQTNELNDMREQLELLKRKVEREERLGEKQIRHAMRQKVSHINRQGRFFVILALVSIPLFIVSRNVLPVSELFCGVTCGFLALAALYTHLIHSKLSAEVIARDHLMTVARRLISLKQGYNRWLLFSIPFVLVWIFWYVHELRAILSPEIFSSAMISCAVGGVIGFVIGFHKHLQVQRACSELLEQIEEVSQEE